MSDAVQQIKDKLTIEDVVSSYVELHKAGKHFKGKSPFSPEKTPSFYVSPDRGVYYCFSTNQGGDMFSFIQAMEGVDFKGSLKILAEKAGVELVREDPQKRTERDNQYAILEEVTKFYTEQLDQNPSAKKYVIDRGVTEKTIQLWRIGFAPDEWRAGRAHLLVKRHTDAELRKAGLVKGDPGKDPYDVFRNRIMFPMADASGRIVAFSGRTLSSDKETPKYVNSPETELFKKSELLYGYDKARQGIRKFDFSLIVEGQFDVVLCHQAGYNNTIAVSGTALTSHHVQLLQRLSNRVVLALDADRAGLSAVKRAADLMLARGMDIKVARMPEGMDPADMIKDNPHSFKEVIGHSVTVVEHLLHALQKDARDERVLGIRISDELLPLIAAIPNAIEHDYFLKLISKQTGIGEDALKSELHRMQVKRKDTQEIVENTAVRSSLDSELSESEASEIVPERNRLYELTHYMAVLETLLEQDEKPIFVEYFERYVGRPLVEVQKEVKPSEEAKFSFTIEQQFTDMLPKIRQQSIADKLNELRKMSSQKRLAEALADLRKVEAGGNSVAIEETLRKLDEMKKLKSEESLTEEIFTKES